MFSSFDDMYKHKKVERISAQFYQSSLYTHPLTPDYVLSHRPQRPIQRGQIPYPYNKFTMFDNYYQGLTNNTLHAVNDRIQSMLFGLRSFCGLMEMEPRQREVHGPKRKYEDDIFGQTAAGLILGVKYGTLWSFWLLRNNADHAGIYQNWTMPRNRWLPLHKVTFNYRYRVWAWCVMKLSTLFMTYQFTDAALSIARDQDDVWNPILAGIAAGMLTGLIENKAAYYGVFGAMWGFYMMTWRFFFVPPGHPKICLDTNSPFWGIGDINNIFTRRRPTPGSMTWTVFDRTSRTLLN